MSKNRFSVVDDKGTLVSEDDWGTAEEASNYLCPSERVAELVPVEEMEELRACEHKDGRWVTRSNQGAGETSRGAQAPDRRLCG